MDNSKGATLQQINISMRPFQKVRSKVDMSEKINARMSFINPLRCNFQFVVVPKYVAAQSLSLGASIPIFYPFRLDDGLRLTEMSYEFGRGNY